MPPGSSSEQALAAVGPDGRESGLVLAARRGEEEAFREIYRAYREPVWNVVVSLVGNGPQAQDILQTVFFKAFRGLAGFRFRSSLFTWIYRIARNECRNHQRKRGLPTVPLESILGSRYEADAAVPPAEARAREDALRCAVGDLPFKMREVIVLKYQEELSYEEMSRIIGCPPGTVASRLSRALLELEARLRRQGGGR